MDTAFFCSLTTAIDVLVVGTSTIMFLSQGLHITKLSIDAKVTIRDVVTCHEIVVGAQRGTRTPGWTG